MDSKRTNKGKLNITPNTQTHPVDIVGMFSLVMFTKCIIINQHLLNLYYFNLLGSSGVSWLLSNVCNTRSTSNLKRKRPSITLIPMADLEECLENPHGVTTNNVIQGISPGSLFSLITTNKKYF